jgi:hypothetical protein
MLFVYFKGLIHLLLVQCQFKIASGYHLFLFAHMSHAHILV